MLSAPAARGFTLIELLIGISLIGVLLALGAPSLSAYLQNSKIGSATTNYYSALQMARAEAIRRNAPVEFVMTDTAVPASSVTPSSTGVNWAVLAASGAGFEVIDSKSGAEGSGSATATIQVAASSPGGTDGTIVFNGFGGTASGVAFDIDISNPSGGACATVSGPMRCRRVSVSAGGQIKACDPAAASGDSRACN